MKPEVYKQLAASGKYYNTGKVLIGLQHEPRTTRMSRDEEEIQCILLGERLPVRGYNLSVYVLYAIGVIMLIGAIAEIFR